MNYSRPPITEAVVQFRVNNQIDLNVLKKIADKLKRKGYPNQKPISKNDINFVQNASDLDVTVRHSPGYHMSSDDEADIVILEPDSLLISRLAPYPGWDSFYERVKSVWKLWKSADKTQNISRVGIRYINRIDIPINESEVINIEDYLNFYPKDCTFIDVPMSNYLIQITKKTSNPLWSTIITSTQHQPVLTATLSLLLDIDVSRTEEIPLNDAGLLSMLAEARDIKNEIFSQCITQKTEELFR